VYRLLGEASLAPDSTQPATPGNTLDAAVAYLQQALDVARRQHARSLELRAALSLGRFWQQQGKPDSARRLLADVYGWFTEGLDTADLQAAAALLKALGST
jgi:predicted ATPase